MRSSETCGIYADDTKGWCATPTSVKKKREEDVDMGEESAKAAKT